MFKKFPYEDTYFPQTLFTYRGGFIGIHESAQSMIKGLKCFMGRFQSQLEVLRCERIKTDGLTSFLMLNVLEAKFFQYDFLEGYNV